MTAPAGFCSGAVHKAPAAGGPCPCGAVTRVLAVKRASSPRPSLADWLLTTLRADVAEIPHRHGLDIVARADLAVARRAALAVLEAVTYEATVHGRATRRAHHDPSAATVLDALAVIYRDRPGFREEWTA